VLDLFDGQGSFWPIDGVCCLPQPHMRLACMPCSGGPAVHSTVASRMVLVSSMQEISLASSSVHQSRRGDRRGAALRSGTYEWVPFY
jgi:hypothetical protein